MPLCPLTGYLGELAAFHPKILDLQAVIRQLNQQPTSGPCAYGGKASIALILAS
jgi:hypothetical protein